VFLAGSNVYKVKKAVRFPFMDQSTLALRKHACEAEVAINSRFTPELYFGVVPITREGESLRLGGTGEAVDWAVHLKRFDETQTLDLVADRGELTAEMIVKIAALISDSHRVAEPGDGRAATDALAGVVEETLTELLEAPALFPAREAARLAATMRTAFADVRGLLLERGSMGWVRRCHGDLHLRNIALLDRGPVLFDAIEFSESIATTDILYDLAFALMDLWKRDLRLEANLLLNRYLWRSENITAELAGLAALPLFMSLRASVLAKVAAIRFRDVDRKPATRTEALRYFAAARELLQPASPVLVAVGGLSGSGKTALSTRIAPFVGRPPGAIHLRSDIERKRMLGAGELERLPVEGYAQEVTARVFANLRTMAEATLHAGHGVIVDAVHRTPEERSLLRAVAEKTGARFVGLWLDAPLPVLVARVGARSGDASDATAEVVRTQAAEPVGALDWERIDAAGPIDAVASAARQIVAPGDA
jgi:aminoglycoside phosphotransferase family enzyme/predicted kinase